MNDNNETTEPKAGLTPEQVQELRDKGKQIVYVPKRANGKIYLSDGRPRSLVNGTTIVNDFKRERMSKKERRKWRKAMMEQENNE